MNFVPSVVESSANAKLLTMFELLPERNILKLSENRISEIANLAEGIKTIFCNTHSTYFGDNHSLRDFFCSWFTFI